MEYVFWISRVTNKDCLELGPDPPLLDFWSVDAQRNCDSDIALWILFIGVYSSFDQWRTLTSKPILLGIECKSNPESKSQAYCFYEFVTSFVWPFMPFKHCTSRALLLASEKPYKLNRARLTWRPKYPGWRTIKPAWRKKCQIWKGSWRVLFRTYHHMSYLLVITLLNL